MTAPRRKVRGLAASPFIPESPTPTAAPTDPARTTTSSSSAPGSKQRLSVYVTPELADSARDTFTGIGDHDGDPESLSDFVSAAIQTEIRRLERERNDGKPFPARRQRKLRPGQR